MSGRPIVRKSDIGAPPARLSGAPPSISAVMAKRGMKANFKIGAIRQFSTPPRKRRFDDNFDMEDSDSEVSSGDEQDDESGLEESRDRSEAFEEKSRKPRKKRRFRLTDSIAKAKRKAERKLQLAMERKERGDAKLDAPAKKEKEDEKKKSPTPPPVSKDSMIRSYTPMQLLCDHMLRQLQNKDPEEYFAYPVTPSMAPDYHKVIKEPMDFSTVREKIDTGKYDDLMTFKKDIVLIADNALSYNEPQTVYNVAAQKLMNLINYYFSELFLRYVFHMLPFCKDIPLEKMGLLPKSRQPVLPKVQRDATIVDNLTTPKILESVDSSVRERLSRRMPDLNVLPDCSSGKEPKGHLAFLDNKNGAVCLNVINSTTSEHTSMSLGDLLGNLDEGTPGLCASSDYKIPPEVPISYLCYGPFSSFAPQYESTWTNLSERDSRLLLSTYGDKENALNAITLRRAVEDCGEETIKIVDDLLDSFTDGEHRRTIEAIGNDSGPKPDVKLTDDNVDMAKLLDQIDSLKNIGVDVSFVEHYRKVFGAFGSSDTPQTSIEAVNRDDFRVQDELDRTGLMISDLALLQRNRLSSVPPTTLTDQPVPSKLELDLAGQVQNRLQAQIQENTRPSDVISAGVIHGAVGLNEEDVDFLKEFFIPQTD